MNKYCIWCDKEIEENEEIVDQGNDDVGSQPFHKECFDKAKDKTGY